MIRITAALSFSILLGASLPVDANAQQVTGTMGSPSATTTIDGKQLPPPPKFGGVIKEIAKDSKTWWPPTELSMGFSGNESVITPNNATIGDRDESR